jgi:hypothetical protein
MVKTMHRLLTLFLLIWSNYGYTWSCYFSQTKDGWYQDGSMVCNGIDPQIALEEHYCTWYRPQDPICSSLIQPICVDSIEYITESCPINYSGGIQKSRTYVCQQASWTDWSITSNNCTPNPPTCHSSSDSRSLACADGYDGQITETRISYCLDPYGEQVWQEWVQTENTCTLSQTDPISPTSVTNPLNPVTPSPIESVTVPIIESVSTTEELSIAEKINDASDNVNDSDTSKRNSTTEVKDNKQDGNTDSSKKNENATVNDTKEIVHGFGLTLSMDILMKPMEFYQPPLTDMFSITQEFPIEQRLIEEFYADVFRQDVIENYLIDNSNRSWEWIRRSDILQ